MNFVAQIQTCGLALGLLVAPLLTAPSQAQKPKPRVPVERTPVQPVPVARVPVRVMPVRTSLAELQLEQNRLKVGAYKAVTLPSKLATKAGKPIEISKLINATKIDKTKFSIASSGIRIPPLNTVLTSATSVDDWFNRLPEWGVYNQTKPDKTQTTNQGTGTETQDGRSYTTTRTKYSITDTPEEIVTFAPVNGFWPGGLVQEEGLSLGLGSIQEIPVPATKRAEMKLSTDLPMTANFREIPAPSTSTTSSAIASLMQAGNSVAWGGARTLKIVDNYSEEQTSHELGLDARYAMASIQASFASDRFGSNHTITAAFTERAFTVQADFEGRSRREAFFKPTFEVADAIELVNQKRVTTTNLPAYIKSVTYGRIVLFNITSVLSESEMRGAINASYNAGVGSVNVNYQGSQEQRNTQFEVRATALGGPQSGFTQLIPASGITEVMQVMNSYLSQSAALTTMLPISYTANTMRDDQLAALSTTTEYTVTKYAANPIGERYKVKMYVDVTGKPSDGLGDHTYETYGYLRVNGDVWWEIPNNKGNNPKHSQNAMVKISEDIETRRKRDFTYDYFYDTKKPFVFNLLLMDHDSLSADDQWMKVDKTLDLKNLSGKTTTYTNGTGRLTVIVELLEYL